MSGVFALQKSLYLTLTQDASLMLLVRHISDDAPPSLGLNVEQSFPIVTIGDITRAEADTGTHKGVDFTFRLHTWSASGSRRQASRIQQRLYDLLHQSDLVISGYHTVFVRWEDGFCDRDPDQIFHGVDSFRAFIQKSGE